MDLLNGGDLRYHICRYRRFDEETTSKSIFFHFIIKYIPYIFFANIFQSRHFEQIYELKIKSIFILLSYNKWVIPPRHQIVQQKILT